MATNLLGRHYDGVRETARLLVLLTRGSGFQIAAATGKSTVLLYAPFRYQLSRRCHAPMLSLCDNGGEVNVNWVNDDASLVSVPSTAWGRPLNAETMHYRILAALDGEEIDYNREEEPIDVAVLLKSA